jgi:hypothetical protein
LVAVHNDYRLRDELRTFWLFAKGNECVKGEGRTDEEALQEVVRELVARVSETGCETTRLAFSVNKVENHAPGVIGFRGSDDGTKLILFLRKNNLDF